METLKIFNEQNVLPAEMEKFDRRVSVRAVVFDTDNNIALVYSEKLKYYTLPGGTIDAGEHADEAIIRECKEEVGCIVEIVEPLGKILEVRKHHAKIGEILGYTVKIIGEKGTPEFTPDEIEQRLIIKWVSPKQAKDLFHQNMLQLGKAHQHIGKRMLAFLDKAFPEN